MVVCMSFILKDLYFNLYGFRDNDPLEDLELPREKVNWIPSVYTASDLISSNQKKVSVECLGDYPLERISDFIVYLSALMSNEHDKSQTIKWLRTLFNLLEVPAEALRYWTLYMKFELDENNKDHKRILRNCEAFELTFLKVVSCMFNTFRSLDINEVRVV